MYQFFIGVDVSKATLDWVVVKEQGQECLHLQTSNDPCGIQQALSALQEQSIDCSAALFCAEYTGMYTYHVTSLQQQGYALWLESGKQIKRSAGIQRGKNDKTDAKRIAEYARRHQDQARLWQPCSTAGQQLTQLYALRDRLLKSYNLLAVPLHEQQAYISSQDFETLQRLTQPGIDALQAQIKAVEQQINTVLAQDAQLQELLAILDSVPGIGQVVATEILLQTNVFTRFTDPKKFACHAGVAPFEFASGKSVKGKTRVSAHANKHLKTRLHLAAVAAIRGKNVFALYYRRLIENGKNKMAAINAVRNKIIHVCFALVRKKQFFDPNFNLTLD